MKTCARYCARVHHVQTEADVRAEWFDGAEVVGLTAGTSTPDEVIDRVEARIRRRSRPRTRRRRTGRAAAALTVHTVAPRARWWLVVVTFAIAMAWVEAACVFYIRALVDRIEPYQAEPAADARRARRTSSCGARRRRW